MKSADVKKLRQSGLLHVSFHTISHSDLTQLESRNQQRELIDSKLQLQDLLG